MVKFGAPKGNGGIEEMLRTSFPGYTGKRWQPRYGPGWRPGNRMDTKVVHLKDLMICQVVILEADIPARIRRKTPGYPYGWDVPEMTLKEIRRLPRYLIVAKEETETFGQYDVWIRSIDPSSGDWTGEGIKVDDFTRVIRLFG